MVSATHPNTSCHMPYKHWSATHAICVTHPVFLATAGSPYTHPKVSCPTVPTLSVQLTHPLLMSPSVFTHRSRSLQKSLHLVCLRDSDTHSTHSLSASPSNPGCHLHTHTAHHPFPIYHTDTSAVMVPPTYILSVCHARHLCHTTCGRPLLKHSLLPMLRGLQSGCQAEIPHLQFHVLSDKKISWTGWGGGKRCVRCPSLAHQPPILLAQESHPA